MASDAAVALDQRSVERMLQRSGDPNNVYAITVRDERGSIWYLGRGSAWMGSFLRTRSPFHALVFSSIQEAKTWVLQLPEHQFQQLNNRWLEVRRVVATIDPWPVHEFQPTDSAPDEKEADEKEAASPERELRPADPEPVKRSSSLIARVEDEPDQAPETTTRSRLIARTDEENENDENSAPRKTSKLVARPGGASSEGGGGTGSPMPGFQPSDQQARLLDAVRDGTSHLGAEARAGSGKSTTCRATAWLLDRIGQRSSYACFNSAIAQEFKGGLPRSCKVSTFHSFGFAILRDALGDVQLDEDKIDRLMDRYFDRKDRAERSATKKLLDLSRNLLLDSPDDGSLLELAAEFEIELPQFTGPDVLAAVPEILREDLEQTSLIDFTDMIWLPVRLGLKAKRSSDVLFVDEAQDLNACQHALVDLICPDGRIIVVGDRYQSIYRFRGADSESIPKFEAKLSATDRGFESYPLTVTRRCPRSHVELAQQLVSDLDHLPDAIDGTIATASAERWHEQVAPGDLVLCRTNAPLVSACYRLIRTGVRASVRGRDIGKGLLTLIARMRVGTVAELLRRLGDYRAQEVEKLQQLRNPEPKIAALTDKVECLVSLCDGASTVDEVKKRAESMFSDVQDDNAVQLSSIHRAKGLERPRVVILRPDLLPGPWATRPEDIQQERNLAYVAVTRARESLVFAGPMPPIFGASSVSAPSETSRFQLV